MEPDVFVGFHGGPHNLQIKAFFILAKVLVEGTGFVASMAPRLELLEVETIGHEVFWHYGLWDSQLPEI